MSWMMCINYWCSNMCSMWAWQVHVLHIISCNPCFYCIWKGRGVFVSLCPCSESNTPSVLWAVWHDVYSIGHIDRLFLGGHWSGAVVVFGPVNQHLVSCIQSVLPRFKTFDLWLDTRQVKHFLFFFIGVQYCLFVIVCGFNLFQISFTACFNKRCNSTASVNVSVSSDCDCCF